MPKTKPQPGSVLPNSANDVSVRFFISDPASGSVPMVETSFPAQGAIFTHKLSEYTTLTPAQKSNLQTLVVALRDETFTLEGYS
jgi:hypothetical protein